MPSVKKGAAAKSAEAANIAFADAVVEKHAAKEAEPVKDVPRPALPEPAVQVLIPAEKPCALDAVDGPAKAVVSRTEDGKVVRLLTPNGVTEVASDDILHTLPTGAKLAKGADGRIKAYRLGIGGDPIFEAASARDAVTLYLKVVT